MISAHMLTLGDWANEIRVPLREVLGVSMDICGRTGQEACKHAIIRMAQSARAKATTAPARRPILKDGAGYEYIDVYKKGAHEPTRLHKFKFQGEHTKSLYGITGTWDQARKIAHKGLAKRSWMWGLNKIGGPSMARTPIPGASNVYSLLQDKVCGYIKENRLDYILKAMPDGWAVEVEVGVANVIMMQAARKIAATWGVKLSGPLTRASVRTSLQSYFLRVA
jgi:hypothetical protein